MSNEQTEALAKARIDAADAYWRSKAYHNGEAMFSLPGGFFWHELIDAVLATPSPAPSDTLGGWLPIATAPRDGTYILLRFDGPFHDSESPGVAIGKAIDREPGWWLTCIWAASTAHTQPSAWCAIPTLNTGGSHD